MNKKTNLSNRAINLLKSDNITWFKWYVLGIWESEFKPYFAIWEAFASCMESWAKTWDYNLEWISHIMEKQFFDNQASDDDLINAVLSLQEAVNNVQVLDLPKPLEAEKEIILELNENYNLKVRFDAFYGDYILDHKAVSAFTKPEEANEKYGQQMRLYQYAWYKKTWEKLPAYIQEVKKARASVPAEYKKEDLEKLIPESEKENLKTVADMKDYLRMHPLKEWVWNRIEFKRNDELVLDVEDLLNRAMKKADYLKTLSLEDVL